MLSVLKYFEEAVVESDDYLYRLVSFVPFQLHLALAVEDPQRHEIF